MSPAVDVLLTRLRWPVPRVRLEAARALAALISAGDGKAARSLLGWISQQKFESEAILGLNLIEAFDLGRHFNFSQVRDAVNAPSHLSDWIIKENFQEHSGLFPFRYSYAPSSKAQLSERVRSMFSAFNGVPQMFHSHLKHLQDISRLPFTERWQHEWEWLQIADLRDQGDPSYFLGGDREITGQFDFGDRETYVSAYLRTLAFASIEWGLPHSVAEEHSLAGLTLNRGLAGVEPIDRPKWSDGILPGGRDIRVVAAEVWNAASSATSDGQTLVALRAVETAESEYGVFEFDLVTGNAASFRREAGPQDPRWRYLANPARYEGGLYRAINNDDGVGPIRLCTTIIAFDVGRALVDLVTQPHLPSPQISNAPLQIFCLPESIEVKAADETVASWQYWYTDWEPAAPREVRALIGHKTLMNRSFLNEFCERNALKRGVWCDVKWGTRRYSHTEFAGQADGFWLDLKT